MQMTFCYVWGLFSSYGNVKRVLERKSLSNNKVIKHLYRKKDVVAD